MAPRTRLLFVEQPRSQRWLNVVHGLLVALCMAAGYLAYLDSRQVTTAILLLFAVVLMATRYGMRVGIMAGLVVSFSYNLVFSDPYLRFGIRGIDDLAPLVAFNLSAFASAYLTGRLRDEARRSRLAHARMDMLLTVSRQLQKAVDASDMLLVMRNSGGIDAVELRLDDGRVFAPSDQTDLSLVARRFRESGPGAIPGPEGGVFLGQQFAFGWLLALVRKEVADDMPARLAMMAIAAERWLLTENVVAADVLRRSEEFKTTLLSSMSHDLRTPLAIINASAGSLLRYPEKLTENARHELLTSIEQQSTRLNQLTDNLLSLVRIEGGLDRGAMPLIDAMDVLGSALVTARQFAPERRITKDFHVAEAIVRADPSLLGQVLINILQNAMVHTPGDTPIHIVVATIAGRVIIAVEDCGEGVSEDQSEYIFRRFHQAPVAGSRHAGSGLGLSIARGFARAVDGDVTVGPRADGAPGARFEISLPVVQEERLP